MQYIIGLYGHILFCLHVVIMNNNVRNGNGKVCTCFVRQRIYLWRSFRSVFIYYYKLHHCTSFKTPCIVLVPKQDKEYLLFTYHFSLYELYLVFYTFLRSMQ